MTKTIEGFIAGAEDMSLVAAKKEKEELVMQVRGVSLRKADSRRTEIWKP